MTTIAPTTTGGNPHVGRLVLGALVLAAGVVWLLDALDVIQVTWRVFFPIALIITGIGVLAAAPSHTEGGLVGWGVVLAVLTVATSVGPGAAFEGGVGNREYTPTSVTEIEDGYALGVGDMLVDLRQLELSEGTVQVDASVGMGQLQVRVPAGVNLVVDATAAMGEVQVFGHQQGGLSPSVERTFDQPGAAATIELDASVGMGQVEVGP